MEPTKEGESPKEVGKLMYLDNVISSLQMNPNLLKDIETPEFLGKFLKLHKVGLTLWGDFSRRPVFNLKERYVCMIKGNEKFRLVNAIFKQNMYSGVFEDLGPLETPVNLFEKDVSKLKRYNLVKAENIFEADLKPGSCLYVPSYYWF